MFCICSAVAAAVLSIIAANVDDYDERGCGCGRGHGNGVMGDYNRRRDTGRNDILVCHSSCFADQ